MIKFVRTTETLHVDKLEELSFDWGIVHMLCDQPMSLDEVIEAAEQYNEIYAYENAPFATDATNVAYVLIRLCEHGMARPVDEEWEAEKALAAWGDNFDRGL